MSYELIIALLAGCLLGRFVPSNIPAVSKTASYVMKAGIFLLVFMLGLGLGQNRAMLEELPRLGLTAVILCICGMAGGALLVKLLLHLFDKKKEEQK